MSEKTIYVNYNDSVEDIIRELEAVSSKYIFLVIPKGATIFSDPYRLRIIKREGDLLGKIVSVITMDPDGKNVAQRAGFSVIDDIEGIEYFNRYTPTPVQSSVPQNNAAPLASPLSPQKPTMADIKPMSEVREEEEEGKLRKAEAADEQSLDTDEEQEQAEVLEVHQNSKETDKRLTIRHRGTHMHRTAAVPTEDSVAKEPLQERDQVPTSGDIGEQQLKINYHDLFYAPEDGISQESKEAMKQRSKAIDLSFLRSAEGDDGKIPQRDFLRQPKGGKLKIAIIILIILALLGGGTYAYAALPKATITVYPKTDVFTQTYKIVAAKDASSVNLATQTIPAEVFTITDSNQQTFKATGGQSGPTKAQGTITISSSLPYAQTMVPSRFATADGKIFWTQSDITLPAATSQGGAVTPSTTTATVVADQAGPSGNISCSAQSPCAFTVPAWQGTGNYTAVTAQATSSFFGGSNGGANSVSAGDSSSAQAAVQQSVSEKLSQDIAQKLPPDLVLLNNAYQDNVVSQQASQPNTSGNFTYSMTVERQVIVFNKNDMLSVIKSDVQKDLTPVSSQKSPLFNTMKLSYAALQPSDMNFSKGTVNISATANLSLAWDIDISLLKQKLAGEDQGGSKQVLSGFSEIDKAEVSLWPFWVKAIPNNTSRITVNVLTD